MDLVAFHPAYPVQLPMIEEGQRLNVVIEKLSLGGDGIARVDGLVLFVPYATPGDTLEIEITAQKKTFGRAKIINVIKGGPSRVVPPCPVYFNREMPSSRDNGVNPSMEDRHPLPCGGCNFQHLNDRAQLDAKVHALQETFEKIAGISPRMEPPLAMKEGERWRHRNKMQVPFAYDAAGNVVAGFFAPGSHTVVPFTDCLIHSEQVSALVGFIVQKMNDKRLDPHERNHSGWLRHAVIRESSEGKMLLVFVTASKIFQKKQEWVAELTAAFPNLVGILQNVNAKRTPVILGEKWYALYGQDYLTEHVAGISLKISAGSFYPVNDKMAERLYLLIRDWAESGKVLLDLYCGAGGIGILCAPFFENVLGADNVPSSISDAHENGHRNGAPQCKFFMKDARDFLKDLPLDAVRPSEITVILDPPRVGCSSEVLRRLTQMGPSKIIYVSCDPGTLARDVKILIASGYHIEKVCLVDLFPQSSHIESVTLLTK